MTRCTHCGHLAEVTWEWKLLASGRQIRLRLVGSHPATPGRKAVCPGAGEVAWEVEK